MVNPITERARDLRNNPTDAEKKLWHHIRTGQLGVKFRRQYPIGPYFVDFICKEQRLIIELDGGQHGKPDQQEYDRDRTAFLKEKGYAVLRFWNKEIFENIDGVKTEILKALKPHA